MLTHIHIKNFAIVEQLNIDFTAGLSVLSGETGAGKSIWVDAVNVALGQRADANLIRQGQDTAEITVCFDLNHLPEAQVWLDAQSFTSSAENECIIRRIIKRQGTSRSFINSTPCPQNSTRELADLLLATHSQHQHQSLLKSEGQQLQLDRYAGNLVDLASMAKYFRNWQAISHQIDLINSQRQQRDEQLGLLHYQTAELDELELQADEWQTLSEEHQQLHRLKNSVLELNEILNLISDNEQNSAASLVYQALNRFQAIQGETLGLQGVSELLNNAGIVLDEAANELRHKRDHLDLSDERLAAIETRLSLLHDLARKHQVPPEQLLEIHQKLQQKLEQLMHLDDQLRELQEKQQDAERHYQLLAGQISQRRREAVVVINQTVTAMMPDLGMPGGRLVIQLEPNSQSLSLSGHERVSMQVSTNPGQDLHPLNKVASGGELSRISLALQVMIAQKAQTPTLIFDEVDVGIGGKTAAMVGKLLRELGKHSQVLCITHLPQVASQGHHHYCITKKTKSDGVDCEIKQLTPTERVNELARMLGGSEITTQTRAHAEEMLSLAVD